MIEKRIAVLYICTGKYVVFWKEFYLSCKEKFLTKSHKEFFVFTDSESLYNEENDLCIHRIFQKNLGWPGNTLMRFDMFISQKERIKNFDYIFFINANAEFVCNVTEQEFLPDTEDIVVVQHPAFEKTDKYMFPYERRKKSTAYIPYCDGKEYVTGGVNGGTASAFLDMTEILANRINVDKKNGITAIWHDESHLNRYIAYCRSYKLLPPSNCYTEGYNLGYEPVILMRDKRKYFDVMKFKKNIVYIWLCGLYRHIMYCYMKTKDLFGDF